MHINTMHIPYEIMTECASHDHIHNSHMYIEIHKGMYGLKEAGIIAFQRLVQHLAPCGYSPMRYTPGLWKHDTLPTTVTLSVDDFGMKYFNSKHLDYLLAALRTNYTILVDTT